ncbi:hypothetical protein ASZ90_019078 [hydrocarbon metagenome]|uniref:PRC-barrel domain-containing protein n=1 Tax=hydrocarbon metagenome TaxID=938273 RepID=A0A0W8E4F1_9ZZZZ
MMRSAEIKGLAVFSIADGKEIGKVQDLLINPDHKAVEYLVVEIPNWYLGSHVIALDMAVGIGKDAVMVEAGTALKELNKEPASIELLERGVRLIGSRVLTRKGIIVGKISEYYVNAENGQITGCELVDMDNNTKGVIPSSAALTFGKDILVVDNNIDNQLLQCMEEYEEINPIISAAENVSETKPETQAVVDEKVVLESDANDNLTDRDKTVKLFEQRQREYLIGRTAKNNIKDENGLVIVNKGDVITQEMIDQVTLAGKFKELMLDV